MWISMCFFPSGRKLENEIVVRIPIARQHHPASVPQGKRLAVPSISLPLDTWNLKKIWYVMLETHLCLTIKRPVHFSRIPYSQYGIERLSPILL